MIDIIKNLITKIKMTNGTYITIIILTLIIVKYNNLISKQYVICIIAVVLLMGRSIDCIIHQFNKIYIQLCTKNNKRKLQKKFNNIVKSIGILSPYQKSILHEFIWNNNNSLLLNSTNKDVQELEKLNFIKQSLVSSYTLHHEYIITYHMNPQIRDIIRQSTTLLFNQ